MKRENNQIVLTEQEFNSLQQKAFIDGAIASIDSLQKNLVENNNNSEMVESINKLFNKAKESLKSKK